MSELRNFHRPGPRSEKKSREEQQIIKKLKSMSRASVAMAPEFKYKGYGMADIVPDLYDLETQGVRRGHEPPKPPRSWRGW